MQEKINYYLNQIVNAVLSIKEEDLIIKKRQQVNRLVGKRNGTARETVRESPLNFKKQEVLEMPNLKDGRIRRIRGVWEIRYRKDGVEKSFSSKIKKIAIQKFKDYLKTIQPQQKSPDLFTVWAEKALKLKKPLIKSISFEKDYLQVYKNHIKPFFQIKKSPT